MRPVAAVSDASRASSHGRYRDSTAETSALPQPTQPASPRLGNRHEMLQFFDSQQTKPRHPPQVFLAATRRLAERHYAVALKGIDEAF